MPESDPTEQFLSLYNQEQRRIYAYIRTLLFCDDDVEDVFQDTCIALWRCFDQYRPGTNFGAWAREIARHRVLAHGKKRDSDRHVFGEVTLDLLAHDLEREADLYEQRQVALEGCLQRLAESDRRLLIDRYASGKTTVDLAAETHRPISTLYKSLRRIRRTLLNCVASTLKRQEQLG